MIGRAARNIKGKAILYADVFTESIKKTINETDRKRKIQKEYNVLNNIKPKNIEKTDRITNGIIIIFGDSCI